MPCALVLVGWANSLTAKDHLQDSAKGRTVLAVPEHVWLHRRLLLELLQLLLFYHLVMSKGLILFYPELLVNVLPGRAAPYVGECGSLSAVAFVRVDELLRSLVAVSAAVFAGSVGCTSRFPSQIPLVAARFVG